MKSAAWIGADPGMSGALALYRPEIITLPEVLVEDMPCLDEGGLNHWRLAQILGCWASLYTIQGATVERVHAMPKQGVTSSFNFGASFGALKQAFASAGIRLTLISPGVWKAIYGLRGGRENKVGSVEKAAALFPGLSKSLYGPKGGIKDGRAEAALLAHYGSKLRNAT